MKTPISYYGGKQMMASKILNLIPAHNLYCEPFFGGGAIFFAKEVSNVEVINDHDERVMNFYRVTKSHFNELKTLIEQTLHSRKLHDESEFVLKNPILFSRLKQAWAFWVQTNMSYGSCMFGGYGYARKKNSTEKKIMNKRNNFIQDYQKRLECTQIECMDALKVVTSRDAKESFFYCDPPYFNAVMGHYGGYTKDNFEDLLKTLSGIKGKFLMSSYDSDILKKYTGKHKWQQRKIEMNLSMSLGKKKIEVLTSNYNLNKHEKESSGNPG
ncbi:MAG: hypothetical protein HGGPFJEG_01464 [Ignavibacteria bacterium]|nr:hypothetical protein [Ignavibacteria bacterium]